MACEIDYKDLISRFDDLVARGIINYAARETVQLEEDGFALEFHISSSFLTKPASEADPISQESITGPDGAAEKPVCFGPGSDIANGDPGLLITTVCDTHLLVVNKFCMFRPQLLLLTSDSYRRQREPLGLEDFAAVCTVLKSLETPHLVIYNCSSLAGASRQHKHLQILPRPSKLFPDNQNLDTKAVPYRYFMRYLHDIDLGCQEDYEKLFEIYQGLLAEVKQSLGEILEGVNEGYVPHNVALAKEWIVVIPRRSNNFEGVTANAAGMMGSVWLMNQAQLDRWRLVGPRRVLSGLGVPVEG